MEHIKAQQTPRLYFCLFSILSTIGFFAALTTDGYAVASVLGINVVGCIITSIIGFYQNRIEYDKYDWLALIGAFVGIILCRPPTLPCTLSS
jgi:hypothetical protein